MTSMHHFITTNQLGIPQVSHVGLTGLTLTIVSGCKWVQTRKAMTQYCLLQEFHRAFIPSKPICYPCSTLPSISSMPCILQPDGAFRKPQTRVLTHRPIKHTRPLYSEHTHDTHCNHNHNT